MGQARDDSISRHRRIVAAYMDGGPCELTITRGGYPYPCKRADKDPDADVWICQEHQVWGIVGEGVGCVDTGAE